MGERFLRITFLISLFFLFVFSEGVFGKLLDLTYLKTNTEVVIIASFTKAPVVQLYSKNGSQTVHFFVINDVFDNHLFQPISAETVEGVQVVSFEDAINLFVYTITPVTATYHVTGSKLYIRFPISCSTKTMTADFVNLKSEVAFKDLAEFFGLKLIIYDGAKGKLVNTKAEKATVEQVLRNLLTLTGLSYAYSEDKTLYIGTPEEISKSFSTYFHIPEGQVTVENIKKSIGSSVYTTSKSDKSKLFVYGGVKEYKLLADSIELAKYTQQSTEVAQKPSWNYVSYTASDEQIQGLLEKLKKIYDFDYVVLPELKKVALSGADSKIAEQFVINLKPTKTETTSSVGGGTSGSSIQPTNYKIFDVEYPQRVVEILNLLYHNSGINVANGKLYVPSSYEQLVKNILQDPVIANPWKLTLLDIPEDAVKAALQYMSISEKDYIVKSYNDVVYLTLFVNEKTFKNFLEILDLISSTTFAVKSDEEFLKSFNVEIIESFSDGTKLVKGKIKEIERLKKAISEKVVDIFVKVEPTDPSDEIMGKLMGYPTKKADGYWIFTVPESEREKIQEKVKNIRENFGKNIIVSDGKYDQKSLELVQKIYNVEIYVSEDKVIIYGTNAKNAHDFLINFSSENSVIYEIQPVDNALKNMLEENFKVKIYNLDNLAYIVGKQENVQKARQYVNIAEKMAVSVEFVVTPAHIDYLKKVFNVEANYFEDLKKIVISGSSENVLRAASYLKSLTTTIDIFSIRVSEKLNKEAVEKINKLMGLNVAVEQVGDMLYLKGTKEEIEKLKEEINKLGDIPELKYEIMSYEESIDSVIKALYKVETYKTKAGYVVYGTQEQLEKVKELVKLFAEGKKYELVSYPEEMDNVVKALNGVETYKVSNGYYVVGTEEQINNVKKLVSEIKVEEEIKVLTTKLEEKEIGTIVSIYDNKVRYYKIADKLYLIGKKDSLEKIAKEIEQFNIDSEYNLIDGKLLIAVKGKNIGELIMKVSDIFKEQVILLDSFENTVNLRIIVPEFKTFIEYMRSYGVAYKEDNGVYIISSAGMPSESKTQTQQSSAQVTQTEEVIVKDGLISIKASNKNVADIIAQVLSKLDKSYRIDEVQTKVYSITLNNIDYETFKNVFSEWVDIKEIGNVVYVSQISFAKDTKVAVKDGKISVRIDNEPISNVIKSVFESFGYSIVFAKTIDKKATISITDSDLDTFTSVLLNYGIAIKKSGNVYIVDTTEEATKTKTTYTFKVTRGADKVKELIEFYGGKALVNTDAGVVVAYDLNPKNVDDINNMISKISKVRTVLIEAKVVDESLLSSLGYDISTILKSADYVSIGTGGLSVKFKITDFMDIQKLWNQIIDNAEVSLNTSSVETPANTSKGSGKLLANPNILAKSGEEARIFIGDSIPIKVATKSGEQVTEEIKYLEAGIELKITPNINLDDTIELNLYTSVGNFDYSVVIGGLPKQNKREVGTKITLKNGQTLIIGGLAREEVSKSEWKVPILGDLPIIGWLFKGSKEKVEQRNIVIFLTAKIVEQ
jgi:type II secretory pathway component GspD/PulD (secretin)